MLCKVCEDISQLSTQMTGHIINVLLHFNSNQVECIISMYFKILLIPFFYKLGRPRSY